MSITISQCEKVLKKAGVKYSIITKDRIMLRDYDRCSLPIFIIDTPKDYLAILVFVDMVNIPTEIEFKFNSLTNDGENLYFSYKSQEPLTVKIR